VRAHLVAAGEARLLHFSWQRCAAEMADLYRRVADGTDPGVAGNTRTEQQ
jgi:hypothetical protein